MTQEDKNLLLKDICARQPYQPMCEFTDTEDDFCTATATLGYSLRDFIAGKILIKPYLRPLSSMTEEEKKEWNYLYLPLPHKNEATETERRIDWLNEHHFDFRGLVEKGLALEAPEDMYKIE